MNLIIENRIYLLLFLSIVLFATTINAQNSSIENQIRLAKNYEVLGKLDEAEKIYAELYTSQPNNYIIYNSLFQIRLKLKKYDDAKNIVEHQITISNSKVSLYGDLGSVYFLMGNEKLASQTWNDALKLEPENPFAYRTIANYLIENRDLETAIEVLQEGNNVSDDKTIFSYDIANLYSLTMKFEEATEEYCKVLIQKQKQLSLIENRILGYIYAAKATEPTLRTIESIYEDQEFPILLELLIDLYLRTKNYDKALETAVLLEKKSANNGSSIFNFAQKSERYRNFKIASDAYNYIIKNYKNSALYSQAEIGYAKSLEAELDINSYIQEEWKPIGFTDKKNVDGYRKLIIAYSNLNSKYPQNNVGWEAEYRTGKIYLDNLKEFGKADSIFNKILDEMKSLQYIGDAYLGLAQIAIFNNNLPDAKKYLSKILQNRMVKDELRDKAQYLLAKTEMWSGYFTESIDLFKSVTKNIKDENVNDALHYLLILNTFKNDSTNLFSFINSDYLVEKKNFDLALVEFKKLADNKSLFLLKDFAALRFAELLLALNKYSEASIFLEGISKSDEDNIFLDRFLYLLGSTYYYGLNDNDKSIEPLMRIFDEFKNSIYFSKARKIITEINERVGNTL